MVPLLHDLDALLRGRFTRPESLRAGRVELPAQRLLLVAVLLGTGYGLCMGLFGALRGGSDGWQQLLACVAKVPLLFLLTLAVTFPSLYVSSALADSRLEARATLRLLLVAITIDLALLASLGPVVAFFTLSTTSYPFMVLLNVAVFAIAGFAGLAVLQRSLHSVFAVGEPAASLDRAAEGAGDDAERAADGALASGEEAELSGPEAALASGAAARRRVAVRRSGTSRAIFQLWMVIVAVVGAQLGWILRPFIGAPGMPFTFLRDRESNFFAACLEAVGQLLR